MTELTYGAAKRHELSRPLLQLPIETAIGRQAVSDIITPFYRTYGTAMSKQTIRFGVLFGHNSRRGNKLLIRRTTETAARRLLGGDLDAVGHQLELPGFLGRLLHAEQCSSIPNASVSKLNEEEKALLTLTCGIHDIGEHIHPDLRKAGITPVGDIPSGTKTSADRDNERRVRKFHYERTFSHLPSDIIERMEGLIAHTPAVGDEFLHDIYEAAHSLQTMDTVERAIVAYNAMFGHRVPLDTVVMGDYEGVNPRVKSRLGTLAHGLAFMSIVVRRDQELEAKGNSRKNHGTKGASYVRFAASREALDRIRTPEEKQTVSLAA